MVIREHKLRKRVVFLQFVFAYRRGLFAYRHKVFCVQAQGVLRIGKMLRVPSSDLACAVLKLSLPVAYSLSAPCKERANAKQRQKKAFDKNEKKKVFLLLFTRFFVTFPTEKLLCTRK